jgi:hypothetical protein
MGKPPEGGGLRAFIIVGILVLFYESQAQEYGCPPQEKILPCRCSTRDMEFQIWYGIIYIALGFIILYIFNGYRLEDNFMDYYFYSSIKIFSFFLYM